MELATATTVTVATDDDGINFDTLTMEHAERIHRAVGWPPVRLDEEGAIRPPTSAELARWQSTDAAIVDAMEWAEIGEELAHRAPASYASALAANREAIRALRDRDYTPAKREIEIAPGLVLVADGAADTDITAELVTRLRAIAACGTVTQ